MKTLYLDCGMGAAGDMLMAALLELHPKPEDFLRRLNALEIPNVTVTARADQKCGIWGTHVRVSVGGEEEKSADVDCHGQHEHDHHEHDHHEHDHEHEHDQHEHDHHEHEHDHHEHEHDHDHEHEHVHRGLREIEELLAPLALEETVKEDVRAVYGLIADAESHVHKTSVTEIHFHELGTMDALTDIVGVCLLLRELAPDRILASPLCVGYGQVHCAHGILPVPAPATAWLLRGIPTYGGAIRGELCTPTGAALLRHFAADFVAQPVMKVEKIGYGTGTKDFAAANCLRALLAETADDRDCIVELACNLDDMTPESVGFAGSLLLERGALDVYTTATMMKKNRPGILLTCLCRPEQREELLRLIFRCTSTLGIREKTCDRAILGRSEQSRETAFGPVRVKTASGWGTERKKAEYEDLAAIARKNELTLAEVMRLKAELES